MRAEVSTEPGAPETEGSAAGTECCGAFGKPDAPMVLTTVEADDGSEIEPLEATSDAEPADSEADKLPLIGPRVVATVSPELSGEPAFPETECSEDGRLTVGAPDEAMTVTTGADAEPALPGLIEDSAGAEATPEVAGFCGSELEAPSEVMTVTIESPSEVSSPESEDSADPLGEMKTDVDLDGSPALGSTREITVVTPGVAKEPGALTSELPAVVVIVAFEESAELGSPGDQGSPEGVTTIVMTDGVGPSAVVMIVTGG